MTDTKRIAVYCASLAAFLTALDGSVVNVSLPVIAKHFNIDMGMATWVSAAYMIALSCSLLPAGRFLDRFGAGKFFFLGFLGFLLCSAGCAGAFSIGLLIGLRFIQGIAAGMLVVSAFAVIPKAVPESERPGVFALLTVLASAGISLGGPIGGFLCQYASWRIVFLIGSPVGTLAVWLSYRISDLYRDPGNKGILVDPLAVVSGLLLTGLTMVALNRGNRWGWTSPAMTISYILIPVIGIFFLYRERSSRNPLIAWDAIASSHNIRRGFYLAGIAYLYFSGLQLILPFDMVGHRNFSPSSLGFAMLAYSIPLMGTGSISSKVSRWLGLSWTQATAMILVAFGSLVLALSSVKVLILVGMGGCGAGFGLFTAPNNNSVMGSAKSCDQGRVASSFQMVTRVSIACGIVLFELLHNQARDFLQTKNYSADIADAYSFRITYLSGALICMIVACISIFSGFFRIKDHCKAVE